MNKIPLLILLVPSIVIACPEYKGKWKSSKELTMEFTNRWANIEERSKEFLAQIIGTTSIEYTDSKMTISDIPFRKIVIQGKELDWTGTNQTIDYEFLGCTSNTVAIKYRIFNKDFISVLNFQSENIYWEYTGNPDMTENAHTREFFIRENVLNKQKQRKN